MYNMCKISPTRQEAAALAGVVPLLVKLAVPPSPESAGPLSTPQPPAQCSGSDAATSSGEDVATVSGRGPYPLRPLAVSLLCGMAHSTHRTRHELWAHNVVALLLDLLKEEVGLHKLPCTDLSAGVRSRCLYSMGLSRSLMLSSASPGMSLCQTFSHRHVNRPRLLNSFPCRVSVHCFSPCGPDPMRNSMYCAFCMMNHAIDTNIIC